MLCRTGKKVHLHTVVLCALPMATAHVYTTISNVDIVNCPCLLLIKRSRLVPAESSRLRPLGKNGKQKGNISRRASPYCD